MKNKEEETLRTEYKMTIFFSPVKPGLSFAPLLAGKGCSVTGSGKVLPNGPFLNDWIILSSWEVR